MSRIRKSVLVALPLLLLGILTIVGGVFCGATLHVTRKVGPVPPRAMLAEISARDHALLKAWWFPITTSSSCVIVLHGISDSRASSSGFAPMFLNNGYSVLAPDSRAHGESGGEFVTYGLLEKYDVIDWTHWMRAHGCRKIFGLGESLGASILIQSSAVEPVFRAIVAESPFADLRAMGEYRIEGMIPGSRVLSIPIAKAVVESGTLYALLVDHLDLSQVSPIDSIRASLTPVLLIHGLDDHRTPAEQSKLLAGIHPNRDRLWQLISGGHTNASSVAPEEFKLRVLKFIQH